MWSYEVRSPEPKGKVMYLYQRTNNSDQLLKLGTMEIVENNFIKATDAITNQEVTWQNIERAIAFLISPRGMT